ncbi:MAG TPA: ATP-binding cassette domain-containing protein [Mycobacteriales bacterium]|nr:ATP-binding cassette domain-containing protein [Mycobacteriales bacterium]
MRNLSVQNEDEPPVVDDVSFDVAAGEIVAIAGVQGNGQSELSEALVGLRPATGSVQLDGNELNGRSPKQILRAGVGYVPEDRQHDGLVSAFSVAENLILDQYDAPPFAKGVQTQPRRIRQNADTLIAEFDIRTGSAETAVGTLSGGNQQKVVVGRELSKSLRLLIASQPTRGVDVGSTEAIHKRIVEVRDSGVGVIIVSSELDEVLALADRIAVMYRGRIVGILPAGASRDELGLMMSGASQEKAHEESIAHPTEISAAEES